MCDDKNHSFVVSGTGVDRVPPETHCQCGKYTWGQLNSYEQEFAHLRRRTKAAEAEVKRLRRAINDALSIIAGGNPDFPAQVLEEVELCLQEVCNGSGDGG